MRVSGDMTDGMRSSGDDLLVDSARRVLARHGRDDWQVRRRDFWCYVHPPTGGTCLQGWKLHVSATPLSAPLVLDRSADVLVAKGCAFKFAATLDRVGALVSRGMERSGGGKFITAYPELDEDDLRALAEALHRATEGLPGPGILSDRPYRPGSLVHYRFGVFSGVPVLGNDGDYDAMLVAPDGTLVPDQRRAWFSPPAWAPANPFVDEPPDEGGVQPAPKPVLLDGRYLVREVIRHAYTGGVYRATDEHADRAVIIKQARRHTGAELTGRDSRDVRRHEADMLRRFERSGLTPRLVGVFEQQGDVFLVQERLPGVTLRQWVSDAVVLADDMWGPCPATTARLAARLTDLVDVVHGEDLVLRDLNPNNVMIAGEDVRLIDLEMLCRPGEPVTAGFTPGYAPPELVTNGIVAAPSPAADLYGLGATLFYLVTGVDPLLPPDEPAARPPHERLGAWLAQLAGHNPAARQLAPIIVDLVHEDPRRRPTLATVRAFLQRPARSGGGVGSASPAITDAELDGLVADGVDHLIATMHPDDDGRLWDAGDSGARTDACNVQHGAAGVLGFLTQAHVRGGDLRVRDAVATTAAWITRRARHEPKALPGLYFGRSGTAWSLLDAGRVLADQQLIRRATELALRVPVRWPNPDVCHGSAGAGLTQLYFWEVTGHQPFLDRAGQAADGLRAAAERGDGGVHWRIPSDFGSGLAGLAHYGFAHGVAGIGAFLLATGRATGERAYIELAMEAAESLVSGARVDNGAAYWPTGVDGGPLKTHWCSGSSGVGTFLVRAWQEDGSQRLRQLIAQAAVAVWRSRWHPGPTQCHGLAGDAEFLLDVGDAFGDERYRHWARDLATSIRTRHARRAGRRVTPDETGTTVVADFNTGLSGVLSFLLRLRHGGPRLWLPASLALLSRSQDERR